jgi:hypothetical protein
MNEIVNKELTPAEILDNQLMEKLKFWGIPGEFVIEDEAKGPLLAALNSKDIESVYIDKENGLCIDFSGDGYE